MIRLYDTWDIPETLERPLPRERIEAVLETLHAELNYRTGDGPLNKQLDMIARAYRNALLQQLDDCDILTSRQWHRVRSNARDVAFALIKNDSLAHATDAAIMETMEEGARSPFLAFLQARHPELFKEERYLDIEEYGVRHGALSREFREEWGEVNVVNGAFIEADAAVRAVDAYAQVCMLIDCGHVANRVVCDAPDAPVLPVSTVLGKPAIRTLIEALKQQRDTAPAPTAFEQARQKAGNDFLAAVMARVEACPVLHPQQYRDIMNEVFTKQTAALLRLKDPSRETVEAEVLKADRQYIHSPYVGFLVEKKLIATDGSLRADYAPRKKQLDDKFKHGMKEKTAAIAMIDNFEVTQKRLAMRSMAASMDPLIDTVCASLPLPRGRAC